MDPAIISYYKWYESQYGEVINLNRLKEKADKDQIIWLKKITENFKFPFSSIWRHEVLNNMRYYLFPKKTEQICSSFHIIRMGKSSITTIKEVQFNTIYAMLYSSYNKELEFDFVSACPTFRSADGEYRHRFITYQQFLEVYQERTDAFNLIEDHIIEQMQEKLIEFKVDHIIPDSYKNKKDIEKKLENFINNNRLPIIFYLGAWLIDYVKYNENKLENHICDGYKESMFSNTDKDFYQKFTEKINLQIQYAILHQLTRFRKTKEQHHKSLEIGQKFIPLTVYETENADDIKLNPWKEMYVSSIITDLVINGICPSFPVFDDWFFIQGNRPEFWSNRVSHIKLDHSNIAEDAVKKLEIARKDTYVVDTKKKKEIYVSFRMEQLSTYIDMPIKYAEQHMILADVILCSLTEHVGRTIADIPALLEMRDYNFVYVGPIFKNYRLFSKHIFEFLYAMLAMNNKLGIVHGDLHLNNVTMFGKRPFIDPETYKWFLTNPYIIYNILDNNYIFPHQGVFSCIIDFSRSFIDPEKLEKDFPANYQDVISNQKSKALRILEHEIPDFYKANETNFKISIIDDNYYKFYKIFMAIDIFKLSKGLLALVQMEVLNKPNRLKIYADEDMLIDKAVPLLRKVNDMSYRFMTTHFDALFNKKFTVPENPAGMIINECFKEFLVDNFKPIPGQEITLTDYFSIENTIQYNGRNYDDFPPTIKFDYILKNKIPIEQEGLANYQEYEAYVKKESIAQKIENISDKIKSEKAERRGLDEILEKAAIEDPPKIDEIATTIEYYYDT
jgi:hypothetical protein